eukprot:3535226-Prorocentrum_lima.AAC.1
MAAWIVRRAQWNTDHNARQPQWCLAVTLWFLETMGIHETMRAHSEQGAAAEQRGRGCGRT